MYVISSLVNRFNSSPSISDIFDTKIRNLSDQRDCLHRAHANQRRDMDQFKVEILDRIDTLTEVRQK